MNLKTIFKATILAASIALALAQPALAGDAKMCRTLSSISLAAARARDAGMPMAKAQSLITANFQQHHSDQYSQYRLAGMLGIVELVYTGEALSKMGPKAIEQYEFQSCMNDG